MSTRQKLSVVMITKNEAELLPDCLQSVNWADEIIVLDSGSSDQTCDIARQAGAKVFHSGQWPGYGLQRQHAQQYASGDMILMIDADERVTPALRQSIEAILHQPAATDTVYSIARSNWFLGRFMLHSGWYPDRVTRLFPAHFVYNDNLVHESLEDSAARVVHLSGDLQHLTCRDLHHFQQKQLAYANAWATQRFRQGRPCSLFSVYSHTAAAWLKTAVLRAGLLDGSQGWVLAMVNAQYTFNKYAILWALHKTTSPGEQ